MVRVRKEVEIAARLKDSTLSEVFARVARQRINILAYCFYYERQDAVLLLVTNDPAATQAVLESAGYTCRSNPVVLVSDVDRIGAAAELGERLAEAGIGIQYSYASSTTAAEFFAVFKTTDNDRALAVLLG